MSLASFITIWGAMALLALNIGRLSNRLDRLDRKLAEHLSVDTRYTSEPAKPAMRMHIGGKVVEISETKK